MSNVIRNTDDLAADIIRRIRERFPPGAQQAMNADHRMIHPILLVSVRFDEPFPVIEVLAIMECLGLPDNILPKEISQRTTGVALVPGLSDGADKSVLQFKTVVNGQMVRVDFILENL
jgi:hypothetical protein